MDLWLIAATAATGYITKHLQNVSKDKEDLTHVVKPESPRCFVSRFARDKKPNEENFEDCVNGGDPDVLGVDSEEIFSDSFGNRAAFLSRKQRCRRLIKPFSMENNSVVSRRLHREKMYTEDHMLSPFPSPRVVLVSRPLVVTDGAKVISKKNNGDDSISQGAQNCGIPQLRKLETSGLYVKRRGANKTSRLPDNGIGASDAALLLCVGISIGIMSSFVANRTGVNKVRAELNQTESLVKDSEDELKKKDSLTVSNDIHDDEKTAENNSESIGEIEAELVAELERLQINMNSSNIQTQPSDVFELEPEFEVEFAQGELRDDDDQVERQRSDETESNQEEPLGNATPESGNYTVSPRELSLRLHKVINSRCEERIKELEIALQESQRKMEQLVMEAEEKKKPLYSSRLCESHAVKRDSIRKHNNPAEIQIQPLVMNLAGPALDAFNDSYEELIDINDSSEEGDVTYERQEGMSLTSKSSPWSHKEYRKDSSRTSEDVNFFSLEDLLGLSDEDEEERESESEVEKQLIKQIVEKAKQGSSSVFNAQKMLSLMEDIEQNP